MGLNWVFLVVGNRNQRPTYFSLVNFLASYGSWLGIGLVFTPQIRLILWIISISLVLLTAMTNLDVRYGYDLVCLFAVVMEGKK